MKHPRLLCTFLTAILSISSLSPAYALTGISPWAKSDVLAAGTAGLAPDKFASLDARTPISRAEFCAVALNLYEAERKTKVPRTKKVYFKDCKDPYVNTAYEMKLVSGRDQNHFAPNEPVSRQDLCVILENVRTRCEADKPKITVSAKSFPDGKDLRPYAVSATEIMLSSGIIRGVEVTQSHDPERAGQTLTLLDPLGTATREQSLIMANRFLECFDAKPLKPSDTITDDTVMGTNPQDTDKASQTDGKTEQTESATQTEPDLSEENDQLLIMGDPIPVSGTVSEKKLSVFGENGDYYTTQEEAEANMVDITVKVWSLLSSGQKTPATRTFKVHKAIADEVHAVFDEIFEGDEKFPIKDAGGYSWRASTRSEHRQGTAIDLNYMENMECTIDQNGKVIKVTTGSHWTPILDPYSIPAGGDVVRAFAAHGFAWGGDAWTSKRDYMHFSYFGT
ncbi:MAG: M15 family metallopeptidase [Butyricicoccus pullicaecorum]|nr:M15 family metallopeptidase [Butyricicoccus pullicaecorum]MDO4668238.1 M15 family metallopeptidase [Butyricicoccus pullicaecorum]